MVQKVHNLVGTLKHTPHQTFRKKWLNKYRQPKYHTYTTDKFLKCMRLFYLKERKGVIRNKEPGLIGQHGKECVGQEVQWDDGDSMHRRNVI